MADGPITLPWETASPPTPPPPPDQGQASPTPGSAEQALKDFARSPDSAAPAGSQDGSIVQGAPNQTGGMGGGDKVADDIAQGVTELPQAVGRAALKATVDAVHTLDRGIIAGSQLMGDTDADHGWFYEMAKANLDLQVSDSGKPQSTTGNLTEGVSQFVMGLAGISKVTKAYGMAADLGNLVKGSIDAGLTGAITFDPYEKRLSNLVESHPALSNAVTSFLAADPNDDQTSARFKAFLENVGLGAAGEGLMGLLGAFRKAKPMADAGDVAGAAKLMNDAADAAQAAPTEAAQGAPAAVPMPPPAAPFKDADTFANEVAKMASGGQLDAFGPVTGRHWNFDYFTQTQAKMVLNKMAEYSAPDLTTVQKLSDVKEMADTFGMTPELLTQRLASYAASANDMAATMHAGKQYVQFLSQNIAALAKQREVAMANGMSGIPEMEQMQGLAAHLKEISENVLNIRTAAARTTSAGRITVDPLTQSMLGLCDTPKQMVRILAPQWGWTGNAINILNEYRVNSILSSVPSTETHGMGGLFNTVVMPTEKYLLGGAYRFLGSGNADLLREGLGYGVGLWKAVNDSINAAGRVMWSEAPELEHGGLVEHPPAIQAGTFGRDPNSMVGQIINGVGSLVRLNTRFRMSMDELTKQMNYRAFIYGKAFNEGIQKDLSGSDLSAYCDRAVDGAFASNGMATMPEGLNWAQQSTFTQPLPRGSVTDLIQRGLAQHPMGRMFIPFVKVPYNILNSGTLARTPGLNLLMRSFRDDLSGANGTGAQSLAYGKCTTGAALIGSAAMLAASGRLTGAGPGNPEARKQLLNSGWQPYSVRMGDGSYVSYARCEPFATTLGVVADATETFTHLNGKDAEDVATGIGTAVARNLMSKLYLQGLSQGINAMSDPDRHFARWANQFSASFVPSIFQNAAQMTGNGDPYMREVKTALDAMRAKIPGLSTELPVVRNVVGDPVLNKFAMGANGYSPLTMTQDSAEPWAKEIGRLQIPIADLPYKKGNVALTADQHDKWGALIQASGLKDKLNELVQSPEYQNQMTDDSVTYRGSRAQAIDNLVRLYRESSFAKLLNMDGDLHAAVHEDKAQKQRAMVLPGLTAPQQPGQ